MGTSSHVGDKGTFAAGRQVLPRPVCGVRVRVTHGSPGSCRHAAGTAPTRPLPGQPNPRTRWTAFARFHGREPAMAPVPHPCDFSVLSQTSVAGFTTSVFVFTAVVFKSLVLGFDRNLRIQLCRKRRPFVQLFRQPWASSSLLRREGQTGLFVSPEYGRRPLDRTLAPGCSLSLARF